MEDNTSAKFEFLASFILPNGFTEPTIIKDFPVRNRNLILHVRRRRYLDENGKNVILNIYPTSAEGTRYSEEFAASQAARI